MLVSMIGHQWAIQGFEAALRRGRLGHAYLLFGPPSVGKTALAMHLGGLFVCTGPEPRPCGQCRACRNLAHGAHPDVRVIEREADRRDITIEQVRRLEEEIGLAPYEAPRKLFCLAGADALNDAAASALLKTLEEPPAHAVLVLCAVDPQSLPITIRSRCQHVTLQPVNASQIAEGLAAQHGVEPGPAHELAVLAGGRPGWAVRALAAPELVERARAERATIAGLAAAGPFSRLLAVEAWLGKGSSFVESRERALALLALLEAWWRDMLLLRERERAPGLTSHLVGEGDAARYSVEAIATYLARLQETAAKIEASVSPRLALEWLMGVMPTAAGVAHAR